MDRRRSRRPTTWEMPSSHPVAARRTSRRQGPAQGLAQGFWQLFLTRRRHAWRTPGLRKIIFTGRCESCQQRCHGCAESRRCMIGVKRLTCVFPPRRHSHGTTRTTRPERQPPAPARRRPQLSCRAPRRCPRARLGPGALCGVRDDVAGDARRGPAGPAATGGLVASGPAPCGAGRLRVADAQHLPEPGTLPRPGGPHPGAGGRPSCCAS